ncbi:MAG: hypothetical protein AB7J32_25195, partial [Pseudonocardia sp.]
MESDPYRARRSPADGPAPGRGGADRAFDELLRRHAIVGPKRTGHRPVLADGQADGLSANGQTPRHGRSANGHRNGRSANGHRANGRHTNGHPTNGHPTNGH